MSSESTKTLPRILCLHGGGVTAEIFQIQARGITRALSSHFRCVFANGPFLCSPGPGMLPVFAEMGPYRRWLRWVESDHAKVDDESATDEVEHALRAAMEADSAKGATGEWVGLLGFSQGAKMVASVLYESELRLKEQTGSAALTPATQMPTGFAGGNWRFAIVMNGRAPLVKLSERTKNSATMVSAGGISEGGEGLDYETGVDRLTLPSLHVHGLQDPGIDLHRRLNDFYCVNGSTEVVEWNGGHRVPVMTQDVQRVTAAILHTAQRAHALSD